MTAFDPVNRMQRSAKTASGFGFRIAFISAFAAFLAYGCSPKSSKSDESNGNQNLLVVKEGVLELEVIPGSFITTNCGLEKGDLETSVFGCVYFPLDSEGVDGKDWDSEYLEKLDKNGWKWGGGEGNAYYLEKPIDFDCNHFVAMIGWVQGEKEEIRRYFNEGELGSIENGVFIFALDEKPVCKEDRRVK